jgi:hypothetical protein
VTYRAHIPSSSVSSNPSRVRKKGLSLGTERAAEFHSCSPARLKSCSERNGYVGFGLLYTLALLDVQSTFEIKLPATGTIDGNNHEPLLEEGSDHLEAITRTRQTGGYLELHRDDWMSEEPRRGPHVGPGPLRSGLRRSERETSLKVWSALDHLPGIYEHSPCFFFQFPTGGSRRISRIDSRPSMRCIHYVETQPACQGWISRSRASMSTFPVHSMVYIRIYQLGSITADSGARASRSHYACSITSCPQCASPGPSWVFSILGKRRGRLET